MLYVIRDILSRNRPAINSSNGLDLNSLSRVLMVHKRENMMPRRVLITRTKIKEKIKISGKLKSYLCPKIQTLCHSNEKKMDVNVYTHRRRGIWGKREETDVYATRNGCEVSMRSLMIETWSGMENKTWMWSMSPTKRIPAKIYSKLRGKERKKGDHFERRSKLTTLA